MSDKQFVFFGFYQGEIKGGLEAKQYSFDREHEANVYASFQEFDQVEILDRFDAQSSHKRFLVLTCGYESTSGGRSSLRTEITQLR